MCGPRAVSAYALARDEGLSQSTLSRWKREAGTLSGMTTRDEKTEAPEKPTRKRPQDWSLEEKLQAVVEASSLSDEELGAYLRSKGLHEKTLNQWRTQVAGALSRPPPKNKKSRELKEAEKRVRKLERELKRKNAALAETAALMVLKKKAQAIWGDGDDDTNPKSGN